MDESQLQTAKEWIAVGTIVLAAAAIIWYLSKPGLTIEDLIVLIGLQVAAIAIPQMVENKILGKAA